MDDYGDGLWVNLWLVPSSFYIIIFLVDMIMWALHYRPVDNSSRSPRDAVCVCVGGGGERNILDNHQCLCMCFSPLTDKESERDKEKVSLDNIIGYKFFLQSLAPSKLDNVRGCSNSPSQWPTACTFIKGLVLYFTSWSSQGEINHDRWRLHIGEWDCMWLAAVRDLIHWLWLKNSFARIQLNRPKLKAYTFEDVQYVVDTNDKQRFRMQQDEAGAWWIRANQGHSLKTVKVELDLIQHPLPICVHGTFLKNWNSIGKKQTTKTIYPASAPL